MEIIFNEKYLQEMYVKGHTDKNTDINRKWCANIFA